MVQNFGFLLFDDFEDLDFTGPWEFIAVWSQQFNGPKNLILISEQKQVRSVKGLSINTDTDFASSPQLDYLLVPGGMGSRREVNNEKLINFIKTQAQHTKVVLSVCTGAFLLQAAGLLAGRQATTHWASLERLQAFPEVKVVKQRFTHDENVWTSAGVSAGIDMALAFIADTAGAEVSGDIQLHTEYYPQATIYPRSNNAQELPNYGDS